MSSGISRGWATAMSLGLSMLFAGACGGGEDDTGTTGRSSGTAPPGSASSPDNTSTSNNGTPSGGEALSDDLELGGLTESQEYELCKWSEGQWSMASMEECVIQAFASASTTAECQTALDDCAGSMIDFHCGTQIEGPKSDVPCEATVRDFKACVEFQIDDVVGLSSMLTCDKVGMDISQDAPALPEACTRLMACG